ncbi:MAG TPA: ABC transporter permease [Rhizomicrobium sp.]|jgi:putative ABC transport system permease protein|nr:ABC transporter permease [Rhizomicrobium sp.]
MFRNYLAVALRNIARHKLYSFINIAGLAVGLTCAILIILFVRDELSYDKWIKGSENLWRFEITYHVPGRSDPIVTAQSPLPIAAAMRDQIPEVTGATRVAREGLTLTDPTHPDRQFSQNIGVVDPNFLQMIPLPLVKGDPRTVLSRPENLVISQSAARKYFGDADPIGKTLTTGRGGCDDAACANTTVTLRVVGVMRDLPHNTQFDFDYLMPNTSLADRVDQDTKKSWVSNSNYFAYVTLAPGADPATVMAKLKPIFDRNVDLSAFTNVKLPGSQILEGHLTHLQDAHLHTDRFGGMKPPGSMTTLYGMGVIGMLILLVACFNFMNLATARATMRAREISLRKCMGAKRRQLVVQLLGEAVLMSLIALVLAFALAEILLPSFGRFMGRPLDFQYFADWPLTLGVMGVGIVSGLLSGFYPALVLSGFRPGASLRTNRSGQSGSGRLRAALVVLQFAVSIGLGIGALVVFQQIQFARNIDLGFTRDNIVVTGTAGRLTEGGVKSYVQTLERVPGVLQVTRSSFQPFGGNNNVLPVQRPGDAQFLSPTHYSVSQDYFRLYNIKLLAGRALQDNREEDNFHQSPGGGDAGTNEGHNVMVNASLAKALGYAPADIIGKTFIFGKSHMRVVGVTTDVLVEGIRSPVVQTVYVHQPDNMQAIIIRIAPGRMHEALESIGRVQRSFIHGVAMGNTLLSDSYDRLYQGDERQGQIFAIFVAIAIFIACLGLFGLAAFTAGRRTKEIGIRKVFGARDRDVIILLLWQFTIPVLIANLIAWPLAWYYLRDWLQGFAYRIPLSPLYFVCVGLAALLIAWATILGHALRVARANPVHALRYE